MKRTPLPKEWLEQKYIKEHQSTHQIAKTTGLTAGAIKLKLKKYEIPLRKPGWTGGAKGIFNLERSIKSSLARTNNTEKLYLNKKWLKQKYEIEKLTTYRIAKISGAKNHKTILVWLKKYEIPLRNCGTQKDSLLKKEHKEKIGKSLVKAYETGKREILKGEESPFWKGGLSQEKYDYKFKRSYRKEIRQRDNYTCFICKAPKSSEIHHIDYNKYNCNQENLITLCKACHGKTNHNRECWIEYFKKNKFPANLIAGCINL